MKNRIASTLLLSILTLGFVCDSANAQAVDLGSGYSCSGTAILNSKGKTVKLKAAKDKIQDKIDALGNKAKNKTKKAALKATKALFVKCSKGQLSPGETPGGETPGGETPANNNAFVGLYEGALAKISENNKGAGCDGSAASNLKVYVRVSETSGKLLATASSPFTGFGMIGNSTATGFTLVYDRPGAVKAQKYTIIGSEITETTGNLKILEHIEKLQGKVTCDAVYSGSFSRDKNYQP